MTSILTLSWLQFVLAMLGGISLWLGWRGRQIDSHPICRKCGFDLVGSPGDSAACSECGADIRSRRAIRNGNRVRRPALLYLGAATILIAVSWIGIGGYIILSGTDLTAYKPLWMLVREADDPDPIVSQNALGELLSRLAQKQLSDSKIDYVTSHALDVQADVKKTWHPAWGDFVESARKSAKVRTSFWERYARQAPQLKLRVRPHVARGDPIWMELSYSGARVGSSTDLRIEGVEIACELSGHRCSGSAFAGTDLGMRDPVAATLFQPDTAVLAKLSDGPQDVRINFLLEFGDKRSGTQPLTSVETSLQANWEMLPAGEQTVTVLRDASLREQIERAMSIKEITCDAEGYLAISFDCRKPPSDLAYEVWARCDGKEWRVGSLMAHRNSTAPHQVGHKLRQLGRRATNVDVVLRPSVDIAIRTFNVTQIWGGTLAYRNVSIGWRQ